jgi:hypothetical protein
VPSSAPLRASQAAKSAVLNCVRRMGSDFIAHPPAQVGRHP